jgi:hypothetical protein
LDVNNDSFLDLLIASGGNEYFGTEIPKLMPRLYLNDGSGNLRKKANAFPKMYTIIEYW